MNTSAANPSAGRGTSIQIIPSPTGSGSRLQASQFLPAARDEVFAFFSNAFQLQTLTPEWVHFSVLTPAPIRMAAGLRIDYRLRVHGVPLRWQSQISSWQPPLRFVDEQTRGPYRRWHHEHVFEAVDRGTICRDIVEYAVYGGSLVNSLFVRPDLLKIFTFRQCKLHETFLSPSKLSGTEPTASPDRRN